MATGCLRQFASGTSLRGFGRLVRPDQHPFLRLLWAAFVLSMLSLLGVNSYYLVSEYFEYHVSLQTDQLANEPSVFPSITVCSHQPFSPRAAQLWSSGRIPSPADFSRRVRDAVSSLRASGRALDAAEMFQNDRVSTYFQNLSPAEARQLGHRFDDLLLLCVMRHSRNTNPSVAHEEECRFRVRRILHPLYFVCYELQVSEDPAYVSSVSMVMSAGGFNASGSSTAEGAPQQAYNLFHEAVGLAIVLHEPGTYPNIDYEQYNVQPGTASTIRYRPERYIKFRSPKTDCMDVGELEAAPRVSQAGEAFFNYTYDACIAQSISRFIAHHCNCTSAFHLSPRPPDPRLPFCSQLDPDGPDRLLARTACARNISLDRVYSEQRSDSDAAADAEAETGAGSLDQPCRRRCLHWRYAVEQSNCGWRPGGSQMAQLRRQGSADADQSEEAAAAAVPVDDLALVTVARATYMTVEHSEKPVITLSALLSRLGGVGSLTLGVTLTVAFELVELAFVQLLRRLPASVRGSAAAAAAGNAATADGSLPLRRPPSAEAADADIA